MTETAPQAAHLLLVDAQALPDIYEKVLEAKRLLAAGRASSAAEAARMTGISRSAFYKYKDAVFPYSGTESGRLLTVHCILEDRPGVLSNLLAAFAAADANILTAGFGLHLRQYRSTVYALCRFCTLAGSTGRGAEYCPHRTAHCRISITAAGEITRQERIVYL